MRTAWLLLVASLVPACVSARDCATAIPYEHRADVIRFALDMGMVEQHLVPRDDLILALGAGTPAKDLDDARRTQLSRWADGYAACITDRVERIYP